MKVAIEKSLLVSFDWVILKDPQLFESSLFVPRNAEGINFGVCCVKPDG